MPSGKNILFVTNNAKKSREMYKKAFDGFGIQASVVRRCGCSSLSTGLSSLQEEIFGSAYASAVYLAKILNFPKDKLVYVIGEEGIEHELKSLDIQFAGGTVSTQGDEMVILTLEESNNPDA